MKFFSLLYQGDLHLAEDEKIIPAEEFSTLLSAMEILEKAKEDSERYKRETEELRKKTLEEAQKEGFDAGLVQFNEQILKSDQEIKRMRHELQTLVLPLALKAAKKIVGKELELFPETIVDIVLQTLAPVTQNQRITIYVNKADKELLEENRPRIKAILQQVQTLSILERADVSPGGCIIETETGIINAGIENQWRALEAAFERYMKR
jgi:type III secretion protein L